MIIRGKHSANYTIVPNALLEDDSLALDEKGLLCVLLRLPQDWTVRLDDLQRRCKVSKDKMQSLMRALIDAGYVMRVQNRDPDTKTFGKFEYHVYDTPQGTGEAANCNDPQPEIPATAGTGVNTPQNPNKKPQPEKPSPEKPAAYKVLKDNKPSTKGQTPPEGVVKERAGVEPTSPSPDIPANLNSQIWAEAMALPHMHRSFVGKCIKRVKDRPNGLQTLLGIIALARKQGTLDPIPYINRALDAEFPPPPDPTTFDRTYWSRACQAAINTKAWSEDWGPRPGEKGCHMPADLVTPDLLRAVSVRRVA